MKNLILFTLISFSLIAQVNAQEKKDKTTLFNELKFAIKGGINYSRTNGDVLPNNKYLTDFHLGAIIKIPTNLNFGVQVEPVISRIGAKTSDGDITKRYTFLDIPVLAQVFSNQILSVEAGPKIGLKIDERGLRQNSKLAKTNRVKTLTFGAVVGTTVNINENLFGQFRFNFTPSDIIKKNAGDTEGTNIVLFQLSLGYWFK